MVSLLLPTINRLGAFLFPIAEEQPFSFITVDGVPNFRGFGGFTTSHARTRRGFVYRSANPGELTAVGKEKLNCLGIRVIIDFTSPGERSVSQQQPLDDLRQEGVEIVRSPMEKESFSNDELIKKYEVYQQEGAEVSTMGSDIKHQSQLNLIQNNRQSRAITSPFWNLGGKLSEMFYFTSGTGQKMESCCTVLWEKIELELFSPCSFCSLEFQMMLLPRSIV